MKLLLHACCGPCSLEPTRLLKAAGHDITIYYANSNIHPAEEYEHRLATLRAWAADAGFEVLEGPYGPATWEACAGRIGDAAIAEVERARAETGAESECADEGTAPRAAVLSVDPARREARCRACYRLRLEETARVAAEQGFEGIGTTLSVSPYQYTRIIREELERACAREGIKACFADYRPFYDEATRRSREGGMYRQNYCGCRFSDAEAAAEREERRAARRAAREAELAAHADERAAAEAERARSRAEKQAYADKQAKKRAILKALREQQ